MSSLRNIVQSARGYLADYRSNKRSAVDLPKITAELKLGYPIKIDPLLWKLTDGLRIPEHSGLHIPVAHGVSQIGPVTIHRLYLDTDSNEQVDSAYLSVQMRSGKIEACRFFVEADEVYPEDEAEFAVWIDPGDGLLGAEDFIVADAKSEVVYLNAQTHGEHRAAPEQMEETVHLMNGDRWKQSVCSGLFSREVNGSIRSLTEFLRADLVETETEAVINICYGVDVDPAEIAALDGIGGM